MKSEGFNRLWLGATKTTDRKNKQVNKKTKI